MSTGDGMTRVLGIDIGGSRSRARLAVAGNPVAESEARSASLAAEGQAAALEALEQLVNDLPIGKCHSIDVVCVGAAGMLGSRAESLFSERLVDLTACREVLVVSDAALVLPAAGLDEGVAVICGTGAAACGQSGTDMCLVGGWGYLLGDDGGGYGLVRAAVRLLAGRMDRGRPLGPLGEDLLKATQADSVQELKTAFYLEPRPGKWAALAPVVLGSADEALATLLYDLAQALDDMVGAVLERLRHPGGLPVVLAGGLTAHPRVREYVVDYLRTSRPGTEVSILSQPPVAGAVRIAQRRAASRAVWQGGVTAISSQ